MNDAAAPRIPGKRKLNEEEGGFADEDDGDALEDLLGLDAGSELDGLGQEGGDALAAALGEQDMDEHDLGVKSHHHDTQTEVHESDSEDNVEIPIAEEDLLTARKLDFSGLCLSCAQARRIAQLVRENSRLTTIQFDGHELLVGDLSQEDELEWDSEEFMDVEAIIIAEILKKDDSSVKRLDLARNQITDDGAKALAQMLAINTTLEYLNLESNMISEKGGAAFGKAVQENSTLQYLNLMYNSIPSTRQQDLRDIWQSASGRGQLGLHL